MTQEDKKATKRITLNCKCLDVPSTVKVSVTGVADGVLFRSICDPFCWIVYLGTSQNTVYWVVFDFSKPCVSLLRFFSPLCVLIQLMLRVEAIWLVACGGDLPLSHPFELDAHQWDFRL